MATWRSWIRNQQWIGITALGGVTVALLLVACGGEEAAPNPSAPEETTEETTTPTSPEPEPEPETTPPEPEEANEPSGLEASAEGNASPAEGWRSVRCALRSGDGRYSGPCRFRSESGGSFALQSAEEEGTLLGVEVISVTLLEEGGAEVRGLTTDGIHSRWGPASRSEEDRACWVGEGFSVCAYGGSAPSEPEAAPPADEGWRQVRCALRSGDDRYSGPCLFRSEPGGTFSVKATEPNERLLGVEVITVAVVESGVGEVSGLTANGVNSRWGSAHRSSSDRSCWEGEGFSVCAR